MDILYNLLYHYMWSLIDNFEERLCWMYNQVHKICIQLGQFMSMSSKVQHNLEHMLNLRSSKILQSIMYSHQVGMKNSLVSILYIYCCWDRDRFLSSIRGKVLEIVLSIQHIQVSKEYKYHLQAQSHLDIQYKLNYLNILHRKEDIEMSSMHHYREEDL